jgi:hypothetical protein
MGLLSCFDRDKDWAKISEGACQELFTTVLVSMSLSFTTKPIDTYCLVQKNTC